MSASTMGRISGSSSRTVTRVPRAAKHAPHSMPTTPPPITTIDSGTSSSPRMPSESMASSIPGMGGRPATEPVAMITSPAS